MIEGGGVVITLSTYCILVVDDEPIFVELLHKFLTQEGFRCDSANNGRDALTLIKENYYDLVLSDVCMPHMDGIQFMREAKAINAYLDFIIFTAYSEKYSYLDIITAGASEFLIKPFDLSVLLAMIKRIDLQRHRIMELIKLNTNKDLPSSILDIPRMDIETIKKTKTNHPALKILIVDDIQLTRIEIEAVLSGHNYELFFAENGQKAIEVYHKEKVDVILMDIYMPVMNGFEAIQKIKTLHGGQKKFDTIQKIRSMKGEFVYIIVFSSLHDMDTLSSCFECGADDFIPKPFNHEFLLFKIKSIEQIKRMYMIQEQQKNRLVYEINERKAFEKALRESEHKLSSHLDQTPLAYIEWDLEFKLEHLNQSAEKLFGYTLCEVKGKNLFDMITSKSEKLKQNNLDAYLTENVTKGGKRIFCRWHNTPLVNQDGQILGMASLIENTTKLYNIMNELDTTLKANENLLNQIQYDYNVAATVFSNVLKENTCKLNHIKFIRNPLEIACGDMVMALPKPSGGIYIFLGDFTGHGLSAAIGAIPVVDILTDMTDHNRSLQDILLEINQKIKNTLPMGKFLAACLMEYSYVTGLLNVWNGGIPDVIVVDSQTIKKRFPSTHLPLGVLGNASLDLSIESFQTAPFDRVYAFSDGIIETFNDKGDMLGPEKFESMLIEIPDLDQSMDYILQFIQTFQGNATQKDDISLIELTCIPGTAAEIDISNRVFQDYHGWQMSMKLNAGRLRTINLPDYLIKLIEKDPVLIQHKEYVYLIMKELISNSLDYGLLKLNSELKKSFEGYETFFMDREKALDKLDCGWIRLEIEYIPEESKGDIIITVEDSGPGFNYHKILTELKNNTSFSGRGLPLVQSICKELTFHENGTRVRAIYTIKNMV